MTYISEDNSRQVPLLEKFVNQMMIAQQMSNEEGQITNEDQYEFYDNENQGKDNQWEGGFDN